MIGSIASFMLIDVFCGKSEAAYYLPIGLLKGSGYFWPSQYGVDNLDESGKLMKTCLFQAVSHRNFLLCIIVFLILIVILCAVNFLLFSKSFCHIKKQNSKKICLIAGSFLMLMMISGCSDTKIDSTHIEVDSLSQDVFITEQYRLDIDMDNNTIMYCPKKGKTMELIRDVFPTKSEVRKIFVKDNLCYYLMENDNDSGLYIRCIDLNTFSDTYIYSDMDENTEDFYGLADKEERDIGEAFANVSATNWFFIANNCIFFNKENYIKKINLYTGKQEIIVDLVSDEKVVFDNNILSYIDANGEKKSLKIS